MTGVGFQLGPEGPGDPDRAGLVDRPRLSHDGLEDPGASGWACSLQPLTHSHAVHVALDDVERSHGGSPSVMSKMMSAWLAGYAGVMARRDDLCQRSEAWRGRSVGPREPRGLTQCGENPTRGPHAWRRSAGALRDPRSQSVPPLHQGKPRRPGETLDPPGSHGAH